MNIGIFGGTFNPVHNGHLHIARSFAAQLELDQVWLIPDKQPPHKAAADLAQAEDRLAMCRLAAAGTDLRVSDLEIRRESASYTVFTLEQLHREHPGHTFYLLMGEDMFCTLLEWYRAERILELAIPCAAQRSPDGLARLEAYGQKLLAAGGQYRIARIPYLPVSSTEIREKVRAGESIDQLVPLSVAQYIERQNLYRRNQL